MAVTQAQSGSGKSASAKKSTTLDSDLSRPQVTQPGDAPADTTDPAERATSVEPDKAAAAAAGFGTVNAVVPLPKRERAGRDTSKDRIETYEATGPDGNPVKVTHNLETGESSSSQ